ncbi:MAG: hypothetical protein GY702_02655 [Desulfobulbaceae bacterium]|nr:hypothetical protein [Desulfobulbaceae bacterium]
MAPSDKTPRNSAETATINDETVLKIAKEITVKFIEVGRVTPATFDITFKNIYSTIDQTVRKNRP